jgi:hypothetical protein
MLTVKNTMYYLNKGESISFQGHQYFTQSTMVHYLVGQHQCTNMEKAMVDRGENGGICGDDMIGLEWSEKYVDVSVLAGHRQKTFTYCNWPSPNQDAQGKFHLCFSSDGSIRKREEYLIMCPNGTLYGHC